MEILTKKEERIVQSAVDEIMDNMALIDNITSEEELDEVLPKLLASLGRYSMSDRAYLFSWASPEHEILRMTHEWCDEGVRPTIGEMQNLRLCDMPNWAPRLKRGEAIMSMDWDAEKEETPEEFALFDGQDIHALIVIPIFTRKKINGYIGFDNPAAEKSSLSLRLLSSIGGHISSLKENIVMMSELYEQKAQLENALKNATLNSEIVGTISKIYWLIYRMNLVTGTYEEISAGQEVHRLTGKRGRTEEVFKEVRETVVDEEHQEIMKRFLDISTLAERLVDTESVAMEYRAKSGSWHLGRFIVKKRDVNGRVTNVLYVVRQIDSQKQKELEYKQRLLETAEDAKRANMAKTDFLRRMSHDIRTPINGIQGMITIAENFPDDRAKQDECREKVKEASGFLLDLVNNILDMNKLESGAVELENKPFDLLQVVKEADTIVEMYGEQKEQKIFFDHTRVQHTRLVGSSLHLKQILQNIAGNAVKYTQNHGMISLSCEELSCDGRQAVYRFICKDTGRGMSREFMQHAFEPFAQEEDNGRTAYMGTGLGLAIAKQLTDMMNGTIELESKLNVGTTFTVTIPFEIDFSCEEENYDKEEIPDNVLHGANVLLVEDNELNIEIAQFLLEKMNMNVEIVRNGKEGIEIFKLSKERKFDFVLMDIMMPVMDGIMAAKAIRALPRKDAQEIPIFAMSANAFKEDIEQSKAAGMNEHLSKPLDAEKMIETMKRYVNKREKVLV